MRQVAEQVGVSATAIYHYFEGKQDLVNRVVCQAFERFGSYLREAMEAQPKGSMERILALSEAYLRFALENEAYFRVMFSIQPKDPGVLGDLPEGGGYHLLRQAVAEAIEAGTICEAQRAVADAMEAGTVRNANPDLLSMYLWSAVHGLVTLTLCGAAERCKAEGIPSSVDVYRAFAPFIADGIRARTAGGTSKDETREREE